MSGYTLFVSEMMPVFKNLKKTATAWHACTDREQMVWNQQALMMRLDSEHKQTLQIKVNRQKTADKRAVTAYNVYLHEQVPLLKSKPETYPTQRSRISAIASAWKILTSVQKDEYVRRASEQNKAENRRMPKRVMTSNTM